MKIKLLLVALLLSIAVASQEKGYNVLIKGHWKITQHKVKSLEQVEKLHNNYFPDVKVDFQKYFEKNKIYNLTSETVIFYTEPVYFIKKKNNKIKIKRIK